CHGDVFRIPKTHVDGSLEIPKDPFNCFKYIIIEAPQGIDSKLFQAIKISSDDETSELGSGAKMLKRVQYQLEQKDLLLRNGRLQHHDVQKKIDDPKMMVNDLLMVHLNHQRWIPMYRVD
nr:hypothetical protein [Tanacetum cinerariifolium]